MLLVEHITFPRFTQNGECRSDGHDTPEMLRDYYGDWFCHDLLL